MLESALEPDAAGEKEWLVGGRCTAADLVFMPYILMSMDVGPIISLLL